jgi:transporter family-2 protein
MIISIILESKGWLGSLKRKLTPLKWLSLIIVTIGIGVMVK